MWYQFQFKFLPQTQYDMPQSYANYFCFSSQWCHVGHPETGVLEAAASLDYYSKNHAQWMHSDQAFLQYYGPKVHFLVALLHNLVETRCAVDNGSFDFLKTLLAKINLYVKFQ
ncbi:hypothetical protein TNCV_918201 [Trichonephila clavipes]|nr:hypothetical protein TNCV_918201 [Trichonephila clavipes]